MCRVSEGDKVFQQSGNIKQSHPFRTNLQFETKKMNGNYIVERFRENYWFIATDDSVLSKKHKDPSTLSEWPKLGQYSFLFCFVSFDDFRL